MKYKVKNLKLTGYDLDKHKERLKQLFSEKILPKHAYQILTKEGILWV